MPRITTEKKTVAAMISLYCQKMHHSGNLCVDCLEMLKYAHGRLDQCLFGENKPVCAKCTVHCYKASMRNKIKAVMRYSGPKMIIYHPILTINHLYAKWIK